MIIINQLDYQYFVHILPLIFNHKHSRKSSASKTLTFFSKSMPDKIYCIASLVHAVAGRDEMDGNP